MAEMTKPKVFGWPLLMGSFQLIHLYGSQLDLELYFTPFGSSQISLALLNAN